jgi:hypothetical protein
VRFKVPQCTFKIKKNGSRIMVSKKITFLHTSNKTWRISFAKENAGIQIIVLISVVEV